MTRVRRLDQLPAVLAALPDPSPDEHVQLAELAADLGREFAIPGLLRAALTLASWVNEHPSAGWPSNACLEFLGDAVLDLLAAEVLWQRFPELGEGALTRLRASLVAEPSLAAAARELGLGRKLWLGRGDAQAGHATRDGPLGDALEAVLAAVYLDARVTGDDPMAAVGLSFSRMFATRVAAMSADDGLDAKSRLQARAQAKLGRTPVYVVVAEVPSDVEARWRVRAELRGGGGPVVVLAEGAGPTLRAAEHAAAAASLTVVADYAAAIP